MELDRDHRVLRPTSEEVSLLELDSTITEYPLECAKFLRGAANRVERAVIARTEHTLPCYNEMNPAVYIPVITGVAAAVVMSTYEADRYLDTLHRRAL